MNYTQHVLRQNSTPKVQFLNQDRCCKIHPKLFTYLKTHKNKSLKVKGKPACYCYTVCFSTKCVVAIQEGHETQLDHFTPVSHRRLVWGFILTSTYEYK